MTAMRVQGFAVAAIGLVCAGCGTRWSVTVTEVPSPAASHGSSEPQLTTFKDRAILSWIETDGDATSLKYARRTDTGWSAPQTVASGDDWFVNWADVPSVVQFDDDRLAAHWLEHSGDSDGYDVELSISGDGGRSWTTPTTPHRDGTPTEHGFASLYPFPGGGLGVVWLDGRSGDGMSVRAAAFDADGRERSESLIDDRACECCPTAVAVSGDTVVAAYRNHEAEEVRDIYVSRLANGTWTAPAPVHNDDWRIDACPINGPALAADGANVAVAWFNARTDQGHAFVAFSSDHGGTFGAPIGVDDRSALGRVDVEWLPDGTAAVSWIEYADGRGQIRVRRVTRSGGRSPSTTVAGVGAGRTSGYPRMTRAGRELLFAWTETRDGASRVRTAAAPVGR
jgi:hypothetical protein